jgi:hypothetical protein
MIRPSGAIALLPAITSENTRPCISGATLACKIANNGPLVIGCIKATSAAAAIASQKALAGARPITTMPAPIPISPISEVKIRP